MSQLLPAGDIVGVHGVRGIVKIRPRWSSDAVFAAGSKLVVKDAQGRTSAYFIQWAKPHKRLLLASFEGVTQREQAEQLVGGRILAERSALPEPAEGEYYWDDLIGLSVHTTAGEYLGRLEQILETGSNDVYVVREGNRETLIPALESVVVEIDPGRGLMRVDLPEGL